MNFIKKLPLFIMMATLVASENCVAMYRQGPFKQENAFDDLIELEKRKHKNNELFNQWDNENHQALKNKITRLKLAHPDTTFEELIFTKIIKDEFIPVNNLIDYKPNLIHAINPTANLIVWDPTYIATGEKKRNWTPLHLAAYLNHLEIVKKLVANPDIDLNAKDIDGRTPLHWAIIQNNVEVVKYLVKRGEHKNALDTISSLQKDGADKNIEDNHGYNAYKIAAKCLDKSISKFLEEYSQNFEYLKACGSIILEIGSTVKELCSIQ